MVDAPASAATLAYVSPSKFGNPNVPPASSLVRLQQAAGAFSLQGVLPWKLPAGDVGVAFGGEWLDMTGGGEASRRKASVLCAVALVEIAAARHHRFGLVRVQAS
jgi:hypothetical protein